METKKFEYMGNDITFQRDNGNVMVNAVDMAKPFNTKPANWMRTSQYQLFIQALVTSHKCTLTDLVLVMNGGNNPGTWMHEDVAMEFARWLSPSFAIWCNDRMKELLKYGATAINPNDLLNPDFIIRLATELKTERAEKELYLARSEAQQEQLKLSAPKVMYFDEVLQSDKLINTNVIAKELGMSAIGLNKLLHKHGIVYLSGGTWVLYSKYQDKGYTGTVTQTYTNSFGVVSTHILTKWTESGRNAIHKFVESLKQKTA